MRYKYGFRYYGKVYCWKEKRLYRMPFNAHLRWHGIRELKMVVNGKTNGYCLDRRFVSMRSLKDLTEVIDYEIGCLQASIQAPGSTIGRLGEDNVG